LGAREFAGNRRFEVVTRLGRGGAGTVYQVVDHARKARLALKAVGEVRGDELLRFKSEFRALAELNHPNIIELGELLEQDGEWFFTMELIAGTEFLPYVRPHDEVSRDRVSGALAPLKADSRLVDHPIASSALEFDEVRLRRSLGQLAEALYVLHLHGQVHRDIKPSNVLVTHEGRVVVIDFGLVAGPRSALSTEANVVGTVEYMAPEQATSHAIGPASDWYAMGAMLYEALTGRLPIEGGGIGLLMLKQTAVPIAPRELVPGVPEDLDALCMELLQIDPRKRPRAEAILERLHVDAARVKRISSTLSVGERADEFVGREEELAFLQNELVRMRAGEQRIVTLLGESGLGKSALLRRFAASVEAADDQALVLMGRCYEQESVPYKALDAVMDQLSRWLKRLGPEESDTLLADDVALLEHTFPVLSRVPAIAKARRGRTEVKDPQQRRLLVMRALRALFDSLARHVPLVVVIDDFQWSDQDSLRMLEQLTGPPNPPPLLLIFGTRHEEDHALLRQGSALKLRPLSREQAAELAVRMARHLEPAVRAQAEAIASQADGSPFLIEALLHQRGVDTLEDVGEGIARSVSTLEKQARRVVEVVCLAGFPITQQIAAEAAGLEPTELIQRLRLLRLSRMVRTAGPLNTDTVEPYHDRIREAVVGSLSAAQREPIHDALARALETHQGQPQQIAYHLRSGGDPSRATGYLIKAAERALEALAFDRAAAFFAEAQAAAQLSEQERRRLCIARGHALAAAGRGRAAADVFAEAVPGSGTRAETLDLKRRIAEQLFNAGYYREGRTACEAFSDSLGVRFPRSSAHVFLDLILMSLWLWMRGLKSRIRERDQLSVDEVTRVDAYWAMAKGLVIFDPIRAELLHVRGLLAALRAGEPCRLSRAIALSAVSSVALSPAARPRADARLTMARRLVERTTDPHAHVFISIMQGMIDYVGHCRWRRTAERLEPAEKYLRAHCEDVAWELDWCPEARRMCLFMMGDWQQLMTSAHEACKEAEESGSRFALVFTRVEWMSFGLALAGDFAGAHRQIEAIIDLSDRDTSPIEAANAFLAHLRIDLCEGATDRALARLDSYRPGLHERITLKATLMRTFYGVAATNVLLAAACRTRGRASQQLYARARKMAAGLVRKGVECSAPLSALGLAAVRAANGDDDGALGLLISAETNFEVESMFAHRAAARVRRGQLLGGDAGSALVAEGESYLRQQGVRDVPGALRLLAAGFPADRHD
jgi:tRNA A-37 threonylcarbamoyl transferase component Bud32